MGVKQRNVSRKLIYIEGNRTPTKEDRSFELEKRKAENKAGKHLTGLAFSRYANDNISYTTTLSSTSYTPSYSSATTSVPTVTITTTSSLSTPITTTAMSKLASSGERDTPVISGLPDSYQSMTPTSRSQKVTKRLFMLMEDLLKLKSWRKLLMNQT